METIKQLIDEINELLEHQELKEIQEKTYEKIEVLQNLLLKNYLDYGLDVRDVAYQLSNRWWNIYIEKIENFILNYKNKQNEKI